MQPEDRNCMICYTECEIIYEKESGFFRMAILNKNAPQEGLSLDSFRVNVRPPSTRWVKKKSDVNCKSADPNDCLVWCLMEIPAEYYMEYVVLDTSQTTDFSWELIPETNFPDRRKFPHRMPTLCKNQINHALVEELQEMLYEEGYYDGSFGGNWDATTQKSMYRYQLDHRLPTCGLNFPTLNKLGINYQ